MISLEKYLLENGFKVYHYKWIHGKSQRREGYENLSSITNLQNFYVKDDIEIICGLYEIGKPGTLISHRHIFRKEQIINDKFVTHDMPIDNDVNAYLQKIPNDVILDAIINNKNLTKYVIN